MFECILIVTMVFILAIFYWQTNSIAQYRDGKLFLVSIPKYAYETQEIQELVQLFKKNQQKCFGITLLLCFPVLIFPPIWAMVYFFIYIFAILTLGYLPLKKYRGLLKVIKKQHQWPVEKDTNIHIDLVLSKEMEKYQIPIYWYTLPVGLNALALLFSLKYQEMILSFTTIFQIIVTIIGLWFICRLANKTYCEISDINIQLNKLRKQKLNKGFLYFCLSNAIFSLTMILYLQEILSFTLFYGLMILSMLLLLVTITNLSRYQSIKQRTLNNLEGEVYTQDQDDYWQISWFGPVYNNPNDSRTMVSSPNGMQMTFNMAKPGFRYGMVIVVLIIVTFLVYLFGYPYYLDSKHALVELSINEEKLQVDSPFYQAEWVIDDLVKVEMVDDLGSGVRTNGTDTFVYGKGHYRYERYGDCQVYLADLHPKYIILYTSDKTYIVNDDEEDKTMQIYQQLKKEVNHRDY